MKMEEQLVQAIRILTPEQQQTVLDFARFLQTQPALVVTGASVTPSVIQDANEAVSEAAAPFAPAYNGSISLAERGIGTEQAAELRARFQTFAEDWDSPEMSAYDEI